jgi:hypothetical protein
MDFKFFESIQEMPNIRRMWGQKYSLWQIGVGTEIDVVRDNIVQSMQYLNLSKSNDALVCLQNAEMGIEAIKQVVDWSSAELACYIKEIDGKVYCSISESMVDEVSILINENLTQDEIEQKLSLVKKK